MMVRRMVVDVMVRRATIDQFNTGHSGHHLLSKTRVISWAAMGFVRANGRHGDEFRDCQSESCLAYYVNKYLHW